MPTPAQPAPKDNGGAAFPRPGFTTDRKMPHVMATDGGYANPQQEGMTLRDWFAGQALSILGPLATQEDYEDLPTAVAKAQRLARSSYNVADAMLTERTK